MITDKQKQKDLEYEADYQSRSPYTPAQWVNILQSGQIAPQELKLIKDIYCSYNHAANLLQLALINQITPEEAAARLDHVGEVLGQANDLRPEVDYDGKEYWWYLCFWGKNLSQERTLEFKMQPELTEAVGEIWPELEQAYYAFVSDVDRSLQTRFSQEDSVWIAAAVLLYEKYYRFPGVSSDDILLMQYEVQTRAQKVFGQDIDANMISVICNADERGHRYNYLRDIYKYYRVAFPGEFEEDRERPDPKDLDYSLYVYSVYGYMTLNAVYDFISHEYAHLVDESYVELNAANGFVRLADFLTRKGGVYFDPDDTSENTVSLKADGEDAVTTFHMLSEALLKEYPNFVYAHKASWYLKADSRVPYIFYDQLFMEDYAATGACISFVTIPEGDAVHIEISLNLPYCHDENAMLAIQDKCSMLTLMTQAEFKVETINAESHDLDTESRKIKASVTYDYNEFLSMKEEDIIGMMSSSMQIFASYYTDICQNYYPAFGEESAQDPLAAALGSKLVYRPAADAPGPQIIYKEAVSSSTTDFVTRAIQGYGQTSRAALTDPMAGGQPERNGENDREESAETYQAAYSEEGAESPMLSFAQGDTEAGSGLTGSRGTSGDREPDETGSSRNGGPSGPGAFSGRASGAAEPGGRNPGGYRAGIIREPITSGSAKQDGNEIEHPTDFVRYKHAFIEEERVAAAVHPDRTDQSFRLYPKNTLIRGPVKTAKYHKAILTAVGIIEGKEYDMVSIEPVPEILEHYRNYVEEGRIMQISFPDVRSTGYGDFIESIKDGVLRDGIFKEFANRCAAGRYVVMMEDVDVDWPRLFQETTVLLRENRREGTSSETAVTLSLSKETFRLPSNLYIVATCDSAVGEDTILGAIHQDFFIRHVSPEPEVLGSMRVEGITLERLMTTLNLRISYFLDAEHQLGEGFFLASPEKDPMVSLGRVFREQIIPLLEKWFDGDIEKIRYVLGDNAKSDESAMFYQEMPFGRNLFKGHIPDSFDTERMIYRINEKAFFNPKSYVEIYQ